MRTKKLLIVAGLAAALAVPAGMAVAADSPEPGDTATTQPDRPGYGQRHGWMMGGSGDPEYCPFHESADGPQWRQHRDEWRPLMRDMHERMWR